VEVHQKTKRKGREGVKKEQKSYLSCMCREFHHEPKLMIHGCPNMHVSYQNSCNDYNSFYCHAIVIS